jgi:hypothetical protein
MRGERLGRKLLRLDALYCFSAGVIAVALSVPLARLFDTPAVVPAGAGTATLLWALYLRRLAAAADWRRAVSVVAAANLAGAVAVATLAVFAPSLAGQLLLAAVAVEVATFAVGQAAAFR